MRFGQLEFLIEGRQGTYGTGGDSGGGGVTLCGTWGCSCNDGGEGQNDRRAKEHHSCLDFNFKATNAGSKSWRTGGTMTEALIL